ncbi:MAG: ABC transporter substrate-binding protein [Enterocloster sp.]
MFKKATAAVLAAAMAFSLTACGGGEKPAETTAAAAETKAETEAASESAETEAAETEAASGDQVTIRFSWWGGDSRHEKTLEAVDAFMKKYPNIKVETEYGAWNGWTEKVSTALAADTAPDVMQVNWNWLYQFSSDGSKFADLKEYSDQIDFSNYDEATLESCVVADKQQALPISTTGKCFYWNKTTFDKAGIALPTTFDELMEAGHVFQEKLGDDYYPLGMFEYERMLLMVYYLESKYEKPWVVDNVVNYTPEEVKEGLDWINALVDNHVLPSIQYIKSQGAETLEKNPDWACGKYAGFYEWDSAQAKFAEALDEGQEFVLGEFLTGFGKKTAGLYKISQAFAITESSQNKEAAATLINFLVSDPEAVKILGTERGMVVNKAANQTLIDADMMKGLTYEGNKAVMEVANYTFDPNFENSKLKDPTGVYYEVMEGISYGDDTAEMAEYLIDSINEVNADAMK